MSTSVGYHEYIGGCSVHWRDTMMDVGGTMSTSGDVQYIGGYHEYIRGYHEYIGDIMSTLGDIMRTSGDVQYIGGCSVHQGFQ